MPVFVKASDHDNWDRHGLKDYGDFADMISECEVQDLGDYSVGNWFFADDENLPAMKDVDYGNQKPNERAFYYGDWGNDASPGASHNTFAVIFDMDNPDEVNELQSLLKEWEAKPETIDSDFEEEDWDEDEDFEEDETESSEPNSQEDHPDDDVERWKPIDVDSD